MTCVNATNPKLRPVEVFREDGADADTIGLRDVSGLSPVALSMSLAALEILSLMDGQNSCDEICSCFQAKHGQLLSRETLDNMVHHLDEALMLEGPRFESHYQTLLHDYRNQGVRMSAPYAALSGLEHDPGIYEQMIEQAGEPALQSQIVGLVAPHLDYPRGWPCYGLAYATLVNRPKPDRVIILGTNHFGRSTSVVSTGVDFQTPLGRTKTDRGFLDRLENQLGSLRTFELDHEREHSIELQLGWLQHLFGADTFELVAFLCPDPCGPTATAPYDGQGVDLQNFAEVLGALIADDEQDTLIVAGADLSHVGENFGDTQKLDEPFLASIEASDRSALDKYVAGDRSGFIACLSENQNPTRVCSAGCMFALSVALPHASATLLGYHQAVDQDTQTCVTCTAIALT